MPIKIGNREINLNTIGALTPEISFRNGVLEINSNSAETIHIVGNPNADTIKIVTLGKVLLTSEKALEPRHGISINASHVLVNAPIDTFGTLHIDAPEGVAFNKPVTVTTAEINTGKLVTKHEFTTAKLKVTCDSFMPEANSNISTVKDSKEQSFIKAREMALQGRLQNMVLLGSENITVTAKLTVDNIILKSRYIYFGIDANIEGLTKLCIKGAALVNLSYVCVKHIEIRVKRVYSIFSGCFHGSEKLEIKSGFTIVALGGRLWGKDVTVYGQYFNFAGWGAAHNYVVDTLFPIDVGLTTPYIPTSFAELKTIILDPNPAKILGAFKAVASFIYKPFGILVRACLKLRTIAWSLEKLQKIFGKVFKGMNPTAEEQAAVNCLPAIETPLKEITRSGTKTALYNLPSTIYNLPSNIYSGLAALIYKIPTSWAALKDAIYTAKILTVLAGRIVFKLASTLPTLVRDTEDYDQIADPACDAIELMNSVIAVKNIRYAADAVLDARKLPEEYRKTEMKLPTDYASIAHRAATVWLPCYVVDSVYSKRRGYTMTGYEVLTQSKVYDSQNYTLNCSPD